VAKRWSGIQKMERLKIKVLSHPGHNQWKVPVSCFIMRKESQRPISLGIPYFRRCGQDPDGTESNSPH